MGDDFDKSRYSLNPVHCRTAGGYIFVCLAENPPPIDDFVNDMNYYLEPYDLDNAKVAVQSEIIEKANWKLVVENNRECYHCDGSHPELLKSLLEWTMTTTHGRPLNFAIWLRKCRHSGSLRTSLINSRCAMRTVTASYEPR